MFVVIKLLFTCSLWISVYRKNVIDSLKKYIESSHNICFMVRSIVMIRTVEVKSPIPPSPWDFDQLFHSKCRFKALSIKDQVEPILFLIK